MRKQIAAANWKMNLTVDKAEVKESKEYSVQSYGCESSSVINFELPGLHPAAVR